MNKAILLKVAKVLLPKVKRAVKFTIESKGHDWNPWF
jgi:hypothetical protein